MDRLSTFISLSTLSTCSIAFDGGILIPDSENQRMISGNYSLTTKSFFDAYMSQDVQQRRLAEMYMIGVIDATEGNTWCGYNIASLSAIQEQVYLGLKNALRDSPNERASNAIKSKLEELLPCKE